MLVFLKKSREVSRCSCSGSPSRLCREEEGETEKAAQSSFGSSLRSFIHIIISRSLIIWIYKRGHLQMFPWSRGEKRWAAMGRWAEPPQNWEEPTSWLWSRRGRFKYWRIPRTVCVCVGARACVCVGGVGRIAESAETARKRQNINYIILIIFNCDKQNVKIITNYVLSYFLSMLLLEIWIIVSILNIALICSW